MHELAHRRALHLDHDVLAGAQGGAVHLGDRGGRERLGVEALEHLLERPTEVLLDHAAHDAERLRRHLVAAALELGDQLLGEDALAGADDLAELDVGGPEPLGGQPEPARQHGDRRRIPPADEPRRTSRRGRRPSARTVRITRAPGGTRPGWVSDGSWSAICWRRPGNGAPPAHGVGLDDPRRVLAEAPQVQVGGGHGPRESRSGSEVRGGWFRSRRQRTMIYPVRSYPQRTRRMAAGVAVGTLVYLLYLVIAPGSPQVGHHDQRHRPDDRAAASPRSRWWHAGRRSTGRLRTSWFLLAGAALSWGIGQVDLDLVRGGARPGGALPGPGRRRLPRAPSRSSSPACCCSRRGRCGRWVGCGP